jgi:glutamine amidotransferase
MCRLLWLRAEEPFEVSPHLRKFGALCRNSEEYQGHGWGCSWISDGRWQFHHTLSPIWEDDLNSFGQARLFLAHARSAFRDEGIVVENNMPFCRDNEVFIFNGELSGVRIREQGRIGAEKVFNYTKRFAHHGALPGLSKAVDVIEKRTRYIRAMNMILATPERSMLTTLYNENTDYFQMHRTLVNGLDIVCSEAYPLDGTWHPIENRTIMEL